MKSGNLIPLNEEFENIIATSPWLPEGIGSSIFSFRDKFGYFKNISDDKNSTDEKKAEYYNECAIYVDSLLNSKNNYRKQLIETIESLLKAPSFDVEHQKKIFFCVREYICELINIGLSKAYIHHMTESLLFRDISPEDDIDYIMSFLQDLEPTSKKYSVLIGITELTYNELHNSVRKMRLASEDEKGALGSEYIVEYELTSYDPVSALDKARKEIAIILNVYNCYVHNHDIATISNGLVKERDEENYKLIRDAAHLMKRQKSKSKDLRVKSLVDTVTNKMPYSLVNAVELHNIAVNSDEPQTQLLTLWTIFELIIDTKQDTMGKVNYISNAVSTILCLNYYRHIVSALQAQVVKSIGVRDIINKETRGDDDVEKFAYILKDNTMLQQEIINEIRQYPLEVYKITRYANILSDKNNLKSDLERHAKRIRWQLMRIYRNRCLVVHDGSHLPYVKSIIENLHFYVDELIDYLVSNTNTGMRNTKAALTSARIKEKEILTVLEDKQPLFSDDDFRKVLFS